MLPLISRRAGQLQLDKWLNRTANIAVVVVALLALGSSAGLSQFRPQQPKADYKPGDRVDKDKLGLTTPSLIMITRSTCGACNASIPFYQSLGGVSIKAVAAEAVGSNQEYLSYYGIRTESVVSLADSGLRVTGVPTLIAVDESGRVIKSWRGRLSERQEADVVRTIKEELR
jgi:hypothetical protein